MVTTLFKILNRLIFGAAVMAVSGCYTVLLESSRAQEEASVPQKAEDVSDESYYPDSRWAYYYDGAASWWLDDSEAADGTTGDDGTVTASSRHYGRRRESQQDDRPNESVGLSVSSGSVLLPASFTGYRMAAVNSDSNHVQNAGGNSSGSQPAKAESPKSQRRYGARESARNR